MCICFINVSDDRPVRESERDAAASHFSTSNKQEDKPPYELDSPAAKTSSSKARIVPSGWLCIFFFVYFVHPFV